MVQIAQESELERGSAPGRPFLASGGVYTGHLTSSSSNIDPLRFVMSPHQGSCVNSGHSFENSNSVQLGRGYDPSDRGLHLGGSSLTGAH